MNLICYHSSVSCSSGDEVNGSLLLSGCFISHEQLGKYGCDNEEFDLAKNFTIIHTMFFISRLTDSFIIDRKVYAANQVRHKNQNKCVLTKLYCNLPILSVHCNRTMQAFTVHLKDTGNV